MLITNLQGYRFIFRHEVSGRAEDNSEGCGLNITKIGEKVLIYNF